ncbi:MAG: patatin-like phospholipase family protein [bacterium]
MRTVFETTEMMKRDTYLLLLLFIPGLLLSQSEGVRRIELDLEPPRRERANFLPYREIKRPKVGLALSGGGARGLAHIGVLKALEKGGIPVDMIAGTSMGSIVGGLYAAGYSADELERLAKSIDWSDLFVDTPSRTDLFLGQKQEKAKHFLQVRFAGLKPYIPPAYTAGQKLNNLLTSLTLQANYRSGGDFDRLNIPFRTVTTDLVSGEKVVLSRGDLGVALRASLTIPLLFTPVERGDQLLADGGIVDYLPMDVVRAMGADIIVAVNILNSLRPKDGLRAPWHIADQVISIIMMISNERQMPEADVVIDPDLHGHSSLDFSNIDQLIQWGEAATEEKIGRIYRLLGEKAAVEVNNPAFGVSAVSIEGLHILPRTVFREVITTQPGKMADVRGIRKDMGRIYNLGYCRNVSATVELESTRVDSTRVDSTRAEVRFRLEENPPFQRIQLKGNTIFSTEAILDSIVSKPGLPVNYRTGERDIRSILNLYHSSGYVLAQIESIDFDEGTGTVTVSIDEGRIAEIDIIGNRRTKAHVVRREFPLRPGEVFNLDRANRGIKNIYSTGLFDRVHLNIQRADGSVRACLNVVEKRFNLVRVGARHDLEYKTDGFIELLDDNLFGYGAKLNLHLQYGQRRQRYELSHRVDRLFKTYLTYRASAYHRSREQYIYRHGDNRRAEHTEERWGGRLAIGQQIYRFGTVSVEGRAEEVKLKPSPGGREPESGVQIRSLILRSVVDNLNRYPFPTSGNYSHLFLELAADVLGGTASYVKFFGTLESYATFFKRHTLHPKLSFGSMDLITPYAERFRVGGNRIQCEYPGEEYTVKLYGYHDEEFVGRQLLWANFEYRYQAPWLPWLALYLSARYDVGYLWQEAEAFRSDKVMEAWGVGLAVDTPLGPAEVDYGRSKKGEDRLYLSLGYWF